MIKRLYLVIVFGCVALFLQGCPPPSARIIYNNAGTNLILQLEKRQVEWVAGTAIRFGNLKNAISWDELVFEGDPKIAIYSTLNVLQGDRILKYKFDFRGRGLSSKYVDRSTGTVTTTWQMEGDNNLYITLPQLPQSMYPIKMPIPQPQGFPLKPVISHPGGT